MLPHAGQNLLSGTDGGGAQGLPPGRPGPAVLQGQKDKVKAVLSKLGQSPQPTSLKLQLIAQSAVAISELQTDEDCRNGLLQIAKEAAAIESAE